MKKVFNALLVLVFFSFGACTEWLDSINITRTVDLQIGYPGQNPPETKTHLSNPPSPVPKDHRYDVLWDAYDKIGVFGLDKFNEFTSNLKFEMKDQSQAGQNYATFTGNIPNPENIDSVYAYFPYRLFSEIKHENNHTYLYTELPAVQTMTENNIASDQFPSIGYAEFVQDGAGTIISMRNLCGLLKFTLISSIDDTPAQKTIKTVSFQGKDSEQKAMAVAGKAKIPAHFANDTPEIIEIVSPKSLVKIVSVNGFEIDQTQKTFYMALPPGDYYEFTLTFVDANKQAIVKKKAFSLENALPIKRSRITCFTKSINLATDAEFPLNYQVDFWDPGTIDVPAFE